MSEKDKNDTHTDLNSSPQSTMPWDSVINSVTELGKEFIRKKYGHDSKHLWLHVLLVVVLLSGIIIAAYIADLNSTATGTLIGSLVGYSFGKFGTKGSNGGNDG